MGIRHASGQSQARIGAVSKSRCLSDSNLVLTPMPLQLALCLAIMTVTSVAIDRLLRRVHLFSSLDDQQLAQVKHSMRLIKLQPGERLFDFGQPAERFFLVVSGQIKLFRVSAEGNEKIIEIAGPGQLFAEAVMFMDRHHYPVCTAALEAADVLSFDNQGFVDLLRDSTDLCLRLLGDLSMRLHARVNEIDQLTLQNATFRVVNYLAELLPDTTDEDAVIDLSAPKNVIAARVSIKPETLSRILHNLARVGIIGINGKTIQVHDPVRLRKFGH